MGVRAKSLDHSLAYRSWRRDHARAVREANKLSREHREPRLRELAEEFAAKSEAFVTEHERIMDAEEAAIEPWLPPLPADSAYHGAQVALMMQLGAQEFCSLVRTAVRRSDYALIHAASQLVESALDGPNGSRRNIWKGGEGHLYALRTEIEASLVQSGKAREEQARADVADHRASFKLLTTAIDPESGELIDIFANTPGALGVYNRV